MIEKKLYNTQGIIRDWNNGQISSAQAAYEINKLWDVSGDKE